ncbi:hypothetical protein GKZ89_07390 [Bacillus mangrovi]|uniref:Uncharacterized protein n=1 Tax=Metabacillus mangrovi TaxID=1491830 RepID=A0A7X2V4L8_9BACI|nr:hypothetical protein [Metabacillus mangrovi]MTH53234.1 hypothetical protein [Metabacillus mangrovi]
MKKNLSGILAGLCLFILCLQGIQVYFPGFFKYLFLYLPLLGAAAIAGIIFLFITIPHVWKSGKETSLQKLLPLMLNLLLLAGIILNPLQPAFQAAEFSLKYQDRMETVSLFQDKKLEQSRDGTGLYKVDSSLSDGSEISKAGDKLLFYTNRGVIDNFTGYIYSPDGEPPAEEEVQADIVEIRQLNESWYYVDCT